MTDIDIDQLKQWTGRSESAQDLIAAAAANALAATLDRDERLPDGAALPPLWHWIYFWSVVPMSGLGQDGHAKRGGFLPPVPLPRRMWAGGRLAGRPSTHPQFPLRQFKIARARALPDNAG